MSTAAISGCGGSGTPNAVGTVSGVVFDINGNPVRGASVTCQNASTTSNSNGSFILYNVNGVNPPINATLTSGAAQYVGQNTVFLVNGAQSKSVNVTMVNTNNLASITGSVSDRQGNTLGGAQVFAVAVSTATSGVIYSSATVLTDNNGNYTLSNLAAGVNYRVLAGGQGYNSDATNETLQVNEQRLVNFTLNDPSGATTATPTNVLATAYTSPAEVSRSNDQARAIQNLKQILNPKYGKRHIASVVKKSGKKTLSTPLGNLTEVDITWDAIDDPSLYGFGIYRAVGTATPTAALDDLQDPLANFYADLDQGLLVGQTYSYAVTSLNTLFGTGGGSESVPSAASTATILGDLTLGNVDPTNVVFNWQPATGATVYAVYLFDQYPDIGVNQIWTNDVTGQQSTGTSQTYTGSGVLVSGNTYYYIVIGRNADGSGVTLSRVNSFVKS